MNELIIFCVMCLGLCIAMIPCAIMEYVENLNKKRRENDKRCKKIRENQYL